VTEPQPDPDDTTVTDDLAQPTDNGPHDGDPDEQPPQDPEWLPEGTDSELA
jgi:hypothetical protein